MIRTEFMDEGDRVAQQFCAGQSQEAFQQLQRDLYTPPGEHDPFMQKTWAKWNHQELRQLTSDLMEAGILPNVELDDRGASLQVVGTDIEHDGLVLAGQAIGADGRQHEELYVMGPDGKFRHAHRVGARPGCAGGVEADADSPAYTASEVDWMVARDRMSGRDDAIRNPSDSNNALMDLPGMP